MAKTLLLLGGSRYLEPVIECAHGLGIRVVTCDYLPGNWAHSRSDAYVNASVADHDAVLAAAESVRADGIMSFACDPGVVTAAYVAEKLGLPFQGSYESVRILQDKGLFRAFLRENGFNCPESRVVRNDDPLPDPDSLAYPVIVKPTDSAGSKGVSRVDDSSGICRAVSFAKSRSLSGGAIIEQFLEKDGASSDADGFTVDGRFSCVSFTSQLFDPSAENEYAPAAFTMPASMPGPHQAELIGELDRLASLLGLRSGIYNIETRVAVDGKPYIMEVSPRGGGNRLAEMLRLASGVDLIDAEVRSAIGMDVSCVRMPSYEGFWYQEVLHSYTAGAFLGMEYAPGFREEHVMDEKTYVDVGSVVRPFRSAADAFGSVMLRFGSRAEIESFAANKRSFMRATFVAG